MASAPSDVDLSGGGGEKLWLAKVPRYLIEQWQSQQPGELVGKLDAGTDGAGSSSSAAHFTIKPPDAGSWPEDLPAECPLTLDEKLSSEMYVFSKPAKGAGPVRPPRARCPCSPAAALLNYACPQVCAEGRVERKGEAKAGGLSREYRQIVRGRQQAASVRREIATMDDMKELNALRRPQLIAKVRKVESKRQMLLEPRATGKQYTYDQLNAAVHAKFQERSTWHRPDLAQHLGVPKTCKQFAAVLADVCERIAYGEHKTQYQLKAEYRGVAEPTGDV